MILDYKNSKQIDNKKTAYNLSGKVYAVRLLVLY